MATGAINQPATGDQDIDGLLGGTRWNTSAITYNFPSSASYYGANYGGVNGEPSGFQSVSASFRTMVRAALDEYAAVANVTFTETGADEASNISVARTSSLGGFNGYGYGPGASQVAGDAWYASSTAQVGDSQVLGRGTWRLVMHELGHTLGLKHGHEAGGPANTTMTAAHDDNDYTIMSYRRTAGGSLDNTAETVGNPQSLMMYDMAALQTLYGANYSTQIGDTVYTWNPATGQESINGVGQPVPGANRIYRTVWDGGGNDTYDLSNYTTNLSVDLRPGMASTFSSDQLAVTNSATGTKAGGNVFNALIHNGDNRSLIENAIGGSGNDTIIGNQAGNVLSGNAGTDTLTGGGGANIFRDTAANHNGDTITDLSNLDRIHVTDASSGVFGLQYSGNVLSFRMASTGGASYAITLSGGTFNGNLLQQPDNAGGTDIYFSDAAVCFTTGTRIRLEHGDVAVEDLKVGDFVLTASGVLRPIAWIGHRHVNMAHHPDPEAVWPVRVLAHAFGNGLPQCDLSLSPDHSVCVSVLDEVLIPIKHLINDATIARVKTEAVTYWHVELDAHDILLAEGMPAESFLDTGVRHFFANADGFTILHPDFHPLTLSDFCRPLVQAGPIVDAVRMRLLARAEHLGWSLTSEDDLHVLADGVRFDPERTGTTARFVLPATAKDVRLASRSFVPERVRVGAGDGRRLGIAVRGVSASDASGVTRVLPIDHPLFADGFSFTQWHEAEAWRWTDGDAALPAVLWAGATGEVVLSIETAPEHGQLRAWLAPEFPVEADLTQDPSLPRAA